MPDLILHHARVYTVDADLPWAEAVAIRKAKILAVGGNEQILDLAHDQTRLIDLGGRLVLPGLCDAHIHFYDWSLARRLVPLGGCANKAEVVSRIDGWQEDFAGTGWLMGRGWNEDLWSPVEPPTRDDLDPVTGEQPALFWRADMHTAVVNSAGLRAAGIDDATPDTEGGVVERDAAGRPSGVLRELAVIDVVRAMPPPDPAWVDAALQDGIAALHRYGITAVHDQRMKDQPEGPVALAAYQRLNHNKELKLRVNCNLAAHDLPHVRALGLRSGLGDDHLRLGHIKLFADGTLGSQTAWLLAPFEGTDNAGICVTPPDQIEAEFQQAVDLGFPVSIHAIGDRANQEVLDVFERLAQRGNRPDIPHRIEHVQTIHPDDLPRLAELGLTASVQPIHAVADMELAERALGQRAAHTYNFASLQRGGGLLAFGSDAPVVEVNPFLGVHAALFRQRPDAMDRPPWFAEERLGLAETLFAYTLGAARAAGWDDAIGSLVAGKRADLIALDRDLFGLVEQTTPGDQVAGTQVVLTVFDGMVVHSTLS